MIYPSIDTWQNTRVALGGNQAVKSSAGITGRTSNQTGTPLPVSLSSASVSSSDKTTKKITISFQVNPSDQALQQVAIWVQNYQGNNSPTKITETSSSPVSFTLQATGENVSIITQSIGKDGSILDLSKCPSKGISL